jgi:hypothetical protein
MTVAICGIASACGAREAELRAERATAERDSLVSEVLASAALINQINVELADLPDTTIALGMTTESELAAAAGENELALARIRSAIEALGEREAEIQQARERIESLSANSSRLSRQISEYESTINELQAAAERREQQYTTIIAQQRDMIAQLTVGLDTARAEVERLGMENVILSDSIGELETETTMVYYAAGTENELKEKGIVVSEGSKFLIFGSKTLQPSRDLDPTDFVAIDKHTVFEIPLPREDRDYRILTRHSPAHLLANASPDGNIREAVVINSPDEFWAPSRFLILVQR